MEETRDEWDAHDEDVEMLRSCEPNSSNFFANEDGKSKENSTYRAKSCLKGKKHVIKGDAISYMV
jgi:hypothetical protein